jgi:RNA polymerase sigma-70 factor (ECF subfamily)
MRSRDELELGRLVPLQRLEGTPSEMSDEALLAACAVGDPAALGALFDRHQLAVSRFTSRLAGVHSADLDDLVSATFLEAARAARAFRGGSSVRTWIFGIAVNIARHHARGSARRRAFLAAYADVPPAAFAPRPDEMVERQQLIERLDRVLRGLPAELRVAFVMCDLEEVTCSEAARALGLRQGTVWKRLHRARKLLGSALS